MRNSSTDINVALHTNRATTHAPDEKHLPEYMYAV